MSQKNSFGNGYGINRNVAPGKVLQTAVPPYGNVTVRPGLNKTPIGKYVGKYFQGAKVISAKK